MFFFKKKKSETKSEKIKNAFPPLPTTRVISERLLGTAVDKTNILINGDKSTVTVTTPPDSAITGCGVSPSLSSIKEPSLKESSEFKEQQPQPNHLKKEEEHQEQHYGINNQFVREYEVSSSLSSSASSIVGTHHSIEHNQQQQECITEEDIVVEQKKEVVDEDMIMIADQQLVNQYCKKDRKGCIGKCKEQLPTITSAEQEKESWGISRDCSSAPNLRMGHQYQHRSSYLENNQHYCQQEERQLSHEGEVNYHHDGPSYYKTSPSSSTVQSSNSTNTSSSCKNKIYAPSLNMEDILQQEEIQASSTKNVTTADDSTIKQLSNDLKQTGTSSDDSNDVAHHMLHCNKNEEKYEQSSSPTKSTIASSIPKPTISTDNSNTNNNNNNGSTARASPTRIRGPRIPRLTTRKTSPPSPPQSPITTTADQRQLNMTNDKNKDSSSVSPTTTTSANAIKKIPHSSQLPVPIGPQKRVADVRPKTNKLTATTPPPLVRCGLPVACNNNTASTKLPVRRAS